MFKIVRHFHGGCGHDGHLLTRNRTITTGLTLDEAQAHCQDPETSSRTAIGPAARRISRANPGMDWFDGYTET